jgi:hypothetical protein
MLKNFQKEIKLLHGDYISIFATNPLILRGNHKYL